MGCKIVNTSTWKQLEEKGLKIDEGIFETPRFIKNFGDWRIPGTMWISNLHRVNPSDSSPKVYFSGPQNDLRAYVIGTNNKKIFLNKVKFHTLSEDTKGVVSSQIIDTLLNDFKNYHVGKDVSLDTLANSDNTTTLSQFYDEQLREYKDILEPAGLESMQESKGDYIHAMTKRLKGFGITYKETKEEIAIEDVEGITDDEGVASGPIKQLASYQRNVRDNASNNLKFRLEFLPYYNDNGQMESMEVFGGHKTKFMDPSKAWNTLLPEFANIVSTISADAINGQTMSKGEGTNMVKLYMDKLNSLGDKFPWTKTLYKQLDRADVQDKLEFFIAMNNQKNKIWTVSIENGNYITRNTEDTGSSERYITTDWKTSAANAAYVQSEVEVARFKKAFTNKVETTRKDIQSSTVGRAAARDFDVELNKLYENVIDVYAKLGINFSKAVFVETFYNSFEVKSSRSKDPISKTEFLLGAFSNGHRAKMLEIAQSLKSGDVQKLEQSVSNSLKSIAKQQALSVDMVAMHMTTVGKNRVYLYSPKTVIHEVIGQFKEFPTTLEGGVRKPGLAELMLREPHLRNSLWLKAMSDPNILKKIEVGMKGVLEVTNDNSDPKDSKDIKEGDYFLVDFHNTLKVSKEGSNWRHKPLFDTQQPSDKNRLYQIAIEVFKETGSIKEASDIFYNYVVDEYYGMIQAKEVIERARKEAKNHLEQLEKAGEVVDLSEQGIDNAASYALKVGYHLGDGHQIRKYVEGEPGEYLGRAFEWKLIPSMNTSGALMGKLLGADNLPMLDNGKLISDPEVKATIKEMIETHLHNRVETLNTKFAEENITFRDLDKDTTRYYSEKAKATGIENKNEIVAVAREMMLRDYLVNSMISKIEYAKIFTGSLQYYKKDSDYIKRVPGTYIDGIQVPVDKDNLNFRQLTFSTEIFNSKELTDEGTEYQLPDAVKSYYTAIDRTDAQAWITPKRWEYLMRATGKIGASQQLVLDKIKRQWESYENFSSSISEEDKLTDKEVSLLSAQPLKGVYYKNDMRTGPVYMKYSQAVLIPEFIHTLPKAKALLDYMSKHNIDEAVADTGVKLGALRPVDLWEKQDEKYVWSAPKKPVVQTLDNRFWRLQQDLSSKGIHNNKVGTQIQKIIIDGLRQMGDHRLSTGVSASKLANDIDEALADLSDAGIERMKKDFGIDNNFVIYDIEKFYKKVHDDLNSDDSTADSILEAISHEYLTAALPTIEKKIISSFLGANKKAATNLMTNGGSFIQISDHLIDGSFLDSSDGKGIKMLVPINRLKPPMVVNGEVIPGQIFIPHSLIAKHLPGYEKMSLEELNTALPKEVKEIIGYRIPTQKRSSTDILEVVGILPKSMGDSIITYAEITAKTGSDFDIDKMFFLLPDLEVVSGVMRVVPTNTTLTKFVKKQVEYIIKEKVTEEVDIKGIKGINKPTLKLKYLTTKQLVSKEDALGARQLQDELKKEAEELEQLINCIWA